MFNFMNEELEKLIDRYLALTRLSEAEKKDLLMSIVKTSYSTGKVDGLKQASETINKHE